jgi:hypothetical protein
MRLAMLEAQKKAEQKLLELEAEIELAKTEGPPT